MPEPEGEEEEELEEENDRPQSVKVQLLVNPPCIATLATVQGDTSIIQPMVCAIRSSYGPSGPKPRTPI